MFWFVLTELVLIRGQGFCSVRSLIICLLSSKEKDWMISTMTFKCPLSSFLRGEGLDEIFNDKITSSVLCSPR